MKSHLIFGTLSTYFELRSYIKQELVTKSFKANIYSFLTLAVLHFVYQYSQIPRAICLLDIFATTLQYLASSSLRSESSAGHKYELVV